jgi:hypothetical protein
MAYDDVDAPSMQQFAKTPPRSHHRNGMPRANFSELMDRCAGLGQFFAEPSVKA